MYLSPASLWAQPALQQLAVHFPLFPSEAGMNSSDSLCIPGAWHSTDSAIQLPTAGSVLTNTPDTWLHPLLLLQRDANLTEQRWSRGSQHAHANQPWDVCESRRRSSCWAALQARAVPLRAQVNSLGRSEVILLTLKCHCALLPHAVNKRCQYSVLADCEEPHMPTRLDTWF